MKTWIVGRIAALTVVLAVALLEIAGLVLSATWRLYQSPAMQGMQGVLGATALMALLGAGAVLFLLTVNVRRFSDERFKERNAHGAFGEFVACSSAIGFSGVLFQNLLLSVALTLLLIASIVKTKRLRRARLTSARVWLAGALYAITAACVTVFLRTAVGYEAPVPPIQPDVGNIPSAYYAVDGTLSVYDKSHVLASVVTLALVFTIVMALHLMLSASTSLHARWPGDYWLPAAALIAVVSTVPLPPFNMDAPHWSHWLGPSQALLDGQVPYLDVFSYYGLIPVYLLAAWTAVLGMSPLSLALLLSVLAFVSIGLIYRLVYRATRSGAAAFVTSGLLSLLAYEHVTALTYPNHSALRFHFFVAVGLTLGYALVEGLLKNSRSTYPAALGLGLMTAWGPSEGAFTFLASVSAVLVVATANQSAKRSLVVRVAVTYAVGVAVMLGPAVLRIHDVPDALAGATDFLSIFRQGYGNFPQTFTASDLMALVMATTVLLFCIRAIVVGRRNVPAVGFGVFALVLAAPYVLQSLGRVTVMPNGLFWVLLPPFAIVVTSAVTELGHRYTAEWVAFGLLAAFVVLAAVNPVTRFVDRSQALLFGREGQISAWAQECAAAEAVGNQCVPSSYVTLKGLYSGELNFRLAEPEFSQMVQACRDGSHIVDPRDVFVYQAGDCRPSHEYQSMFSLSTRKQVDEFVNLISDGRPVYFGHSDFAYQQRLIEEIRQQWLERQDSAGGSAS